MTLRVDTQSEKLYQRQNTGDQTVGMKQPDCTAELSKADRSLFLQALWNSRWSQHLHSRRNKDIVWL